MHKIGAWTEEHVSLLVHLRFDAPKDLDEGDANYAIVLVDLNAFKQLSQVLEVLMLVLIALAQVPGLHEVLALQRHCLRRGTGGLEHIDLQHCQECDDAQVPYFIKSNPLHIT